MRILVPLLLVTAATAAFAPPAASACHVFELEPIEGATSLGYGFSIDADYSGCPHEPTLCAKVWRDGTLIFLACPYP